MVFEGALIFIHSFIKSLLSAYRVSHTCWAHTGEGEERHLELTAVFQRDANQIIRQKKKKKVKRLLNEVPTMKRVIMR